MKMGASYLVKLVRDGYERAPDARVAFRRVKDPTVVRTELRKKLVEEAVEYLVNPTGEELADVLEVIRALANHDLAVPFARIEALALIKARERGGINDLGMFAEPQS